MKSKIMLLITGCIFTVAALAAIQGYFIYNTYKLREKEVHAEVKKLLLSFEDSPEYIAIDEAWMAKTGEFIKDYKEKKASKEDYQKIIRHLSDSLSGAANSYLAKINSHYKLTYSNYLVSLLLPEGKKTDTLFCGKMRLFGNTTVDSEIPFSQGKWQSNVSEEKDNVPKVDYDFVIRTRRYYSIADWERVILGKMAGLLAFSVILLAFVVLLFYMSIKNLITQKKIADIKTDFINNITHEFQTPLATLDVAVKTLQKDGLEKEQFSSTLSIIERQNNRLRKLFGQVTEVSMAPVPVQAGSRQNADGNDIAEIITDFGLSHPDISITSSLNGQQTLIGMDRFHLNTILVNLLDNAVKYGARHVEVITGAGAGSFTITIKDDGPGIPEKERKAIFDKFYRIEKGNIHTTKGLGLGLFYTRQIVEAYGGSISVTGKEGEGAVFILSIPSL